MHSKGLNKLAELSGRVAFQAGRECPEMGVWVGRSATSFGALFTEGFTMEEFESGGRRNPGRLRDLIRSRNAINDVFGTPEEPPEGYEPEPPYLSDDGPMVGGVE